MALGVEPIRGKPYKPTVWGKNERFHQTLFRYLDKQPFASSKSWSSLRATSAATRSPSLT